MTAAKKGLYANIEAKHDRIAHGSGETMRKPGEAGAPEGDAFDKAARSAKAPPAKKAAKKVATKKAATKKTARS